MDKILTLLLIIAVFITACASPVGDSSQIEETNVLSTKIAPGIWRVVDYDAQIVCYAYDSNSYAGGLDCLPLNQTALPRE